MASEGMQGSKMSQWMISPYGVVKNGDEGERNDILGYKNKIKLHLDVANVPPFEGTSSYLYVFQSMIKRWYLS